MKLNIRTLLAVIFGELLCAVAITYFFVPHKLLSGGISGYDVKKQLLILSSRNEELQVLISRQVNCEMTTILSSDPGHSLILYCLAGNRQIIAIKNIVASLDPAAVISISDTVEVAGTRTDPQRNI